MTGYVADLSWKSGARAIEELDRLRSTMAVNVLITGFNKLDFNNNINQSLHKIISWFNSNLLTLNFDKTHYVEFRTKNYYQVETIVRYEQRDISSSTETKFLGLVIDTRHYPGISILSR